MKERKVEKVISGILIGILIILTIFMIADVKKLQGNARVVNYAGIIRGATQRMVKLEVVDEGNDELIQYLDDIFSGLMHGGGKYNLTHLEDTDYNAKLNRLYSYWAKLKEEVTKVLRRRLQRYRYHQHERRILPAGGQDGGCRRELLPALCHSDQPD